MRELQSVLKHALAHSVGSAIAESHLPATLFAADKSFSPNLDFAGDINPMSQLMQDLINGNEKDLYAKATMQLDQLVIPFVLNHTRGNLQQACELLGISRNTLKAKMRSNHISIEHAVLSKIDKSGQNFRHPSS